MKQRCSWDTMKHHSFEAGHDRKVGEISHCNHRPEHTFFFVDKHERIWYYGQGSLEYHGREEPSNSYCFADSSPLEFVMFTGKDFYRVFEKASDDTENEQKDIRECQEAEGKLQKILDYDGDKISGIFVWCLVINGVYYECIATDCEARGEWRKASKRDVEESARSRLLFSYLFTSGSQLNEGDIASKKLIYDASLLEFLIVMKMTLEASLKKSEISMAPSSSG